MIDTGEIFSPTVQRWGRAPRYQANVDSYAALFYIYKLHA